MATAVGILAGRSRRPASRGPIQVVATQPPARGTQGLWIAGVVIAVFWPIGVFLVPVFAYHWPAFPDFPGSSALQILGVVLSAGGGILYARAARALGEQMTPVIQVQQDHRLLQTGPYRYIRHPVYTAILLGATGQALLFLSLPVALLAILLLVLANYRAGLEESLLASPKGFGVTYDSYKARTGRFIPRLRSPAELVSRASRAISRSFPG